MRTWSNTVGVHGIDVLCLEQFDFPSVPQSRLECAACKLAELFIGTLARGVPFITHLFFLKLLLTYFSSSDKFASDC